MENETTEKIETTETAGQENSGTDHWDYNGVTLPDLKTFVRICKCNQDWTFERDVLPYMVEEEYGAEARGYWENEKPFTTKEALAMENAQQRMIALTAIGSASFVSDMNAELISTRTVEKTQPRWTVAPGVETDGTKPLATNLADDMFEKEVVTFKDTYELYRIPASELNIKVEGEDEEDVYVLHAVCPSTGKNYHMFVQKTDDALKAVASTMGLTVDEYLEVEMES